MRRIHLQSAKTHVARSNTIRDINRQIVLNYVRDCEPISRADIARETNLQRSTVSLIIEDLLNDGLIEEIGVGASSGGRKPTMLVLKKGFPVAIGVDVAPVYTTIAMADLAGNILEKESFLTNHIFEKTLEKITSKIKRLIEKTQNPKLLEVGISLPGLVDQANGKLIYVPYFNWENIDISSKISNAVNLEVTVDNDANAIALAELWFGKYGTGNSKNFMSLLVAEGIGTGIVFDGQIYRGEKGIAGEFGHMIMNSESLVECSCGSRDCWEAFASDRATVARYKKYSSNTDEISIDEIIDLAQNGDEIALKTIKKTLYYIGLGLSNLIVGFNPQEIIINGKISKLLFLLEQEFPKTVQRRILKGLPNPHIISSTLGDNPTLFGAISLGLVSKFQFI